MSALAEEEPDLPAYSAEEQEQLRRALRQLPPERQQLIILKFVESLPNAEIGRVMGRSEGAIKSLYHRTLLALREELSKENANGNRRGGNHGPEAGNHQRRSHP